MADTYETTQGGRTSDRTGTREPRHIDRPLALEGRSQGRHLQGRNGQTAFEWWQGGHFLIERSALTSDGATNASLVVTGYDAAEKACIAHSFDNEGQAATFRIGIAGDRLDIAWDRYRVSATHLPQPDHHRRLGMVQGRNHLGLLVRHADGKAGCGRGTCCKRRCGGACNPLIRWRSTTHAMAT